MGDQVVGRGIVIFPSEEVSRETIRANEAIRSFGYSKTNIDEISNKPHLTVYQLAMPDSRLGKLSEIVYEISKRTKPFKVSMAGLSDFPPDFIFWDTEIGDEVLNLHYSLINGVHSLSENYFLEHHLPYFTGKLGAERKYRDSLLHWGNPLTGYCFRPHITLARCSKEEDRSRILTEMSPSELSFLANGLHIVELGSFGEYLSTQQSFSFDR